MTKSKPEYENISISLPAQVRVRMDSKCKKEFKNRSEYIKDLILADIKPVNQSL